MVTSSPTQYERCITQLGEDASDREILECVAINIERANNTYTKDIILVYAAALVFFMQAGFAMICAGAVRKKNVQNTSTYVSLECQLLTYHEQC